jgi:hypothetical protein
VEEEGLLDGHWAGDLSNYFAVDFRGFFEGKGCFEDSFFLKS